MGMKEKKQQLSEKRRKARLSMTQLSIAAEKRGKE